MASFAGNADYAAASSEPLTFTINKAILTITATGVNKVYDGTTAATVKLANNCMTGDLLTTTCNCALFANPNVGTHKTVTVAGIAICGPTRGITR